MFSMVCEIVMECSVCCFR